MNRMLSVAVPLCLSVLVPTSLLSTAILAYRDGELVTGALCLFLAFGNLHIGVLAAIRAQKEKP